MPKLTTNFIQTKITPPAKGKVDFYRDTELVGFGLMVRESGKTFFVEKRVNGKNRRQVLGKYILCEASHNVPYQTPPIIAAPPFVVSHDPGSWKRSNGHI